MSRVGKQPIKIDSTIKTDIADGGKFGNQIIKITGPKGALDLELRKGIKAELNENVIIVTRENETKMLKALHGLYRTMLNNMVEGVKNGYTKILEIQGVGYRARLKGKGLEFDLGLTHQVNFDAPDGITFVVEDESIIKVSGIDKQLVGETAAKIRKLRLPEPYKGKGIRYQGEYVRRKQGKTASK